MISRADSGLSSATPGSTSSVAMGSLSSNGAPRRPSSWPWPGKDDAGVVRSQIVGWVGFGAAILGMAMLIMALARGLAAAVPFAAAPLLAAAAALGVVLALATALTRRRAAD